MTLSSSEFLIISTALFISSKHFSNPLRTCSFSCFSLTSNVSHLFKQLLLQSTHLGIICLTPKTFGLLSSSIVIFTGNELSNGVILYNKLITLSALAFFLILISISIPLISVVSLISTISFNLPTLTSSIILSIISSLVVVNGISLINIYCPSTSYLARILKVPLPVSLINKNCLGSSIMNPPVAKSGINVGMLPLSI